MSPPPMHDVLDRAANMLAFIHDVRATAATIASPARRAARVSRLRSPGDTAAHEIRRANTASIIAFVRDMDWSLDVPGFNDTLGYLADMGKDFSKDSKSLRNRVLTGLLNEFEEYPQRVQLPQLQQFGAVLIIETIALRINSGLRDVPITANSDKWTRWKLAHGRYTQVGKNTGATVEAIEESGRIDYVGAQP